MPPKTILTSRSSATIRSSVKSLLRSPVARFEVLQPRGLSHFMRQAVGGEFEDVRNLLAQHYDVFEPVVAQVPRQATAITCARSARQQIAQGLEVALLIAQEPKTFVAFT